jgi:hypothetical protein
MPIADDDPNKVLRLEEEEEEEEQGDQDRVDRGVGSSYVRYPNESNSPPSVNFNYCPTHGGYLGSKCPGCE